MGIFNLFSKRQKVLRGEVPDVYVYNLLSPKLRVQVVHIISDALGNIKKDHFSNKIYEGIHKILCREFGVFSLGKGYENSFDAVYNYFLNCEKFEECMDIIELSFSIVNKIARDDNWSYQSRGCNLLKPDDAIAELNARFKEAGVGYQFESGEIIRIDSQIMHSEVVKPVLALLSSSKIYAGVNQEFLKAHEHYRHGRNKECLVECLKSFESLMKVICDKRSWQFDEKMTAKNLINVCFVNELIPKYLQDQFSSMRTLLESGIPTVRNKEGGHGQGVEITTVPNHLASYALHLTASNLLFLAQCDESWRQ